MSKKKQQAGLAIAPPQMIRVELLKPAPYNPRTISADKMAALKASLRKSGFVLNLVVQRKSEKHGENVIVGGHQRMVALREICEEDGRPMPEELPAAVLDLSDRRAKQLNVALNNIEGEFDPFKLGDMFADMLPDMTTDDVLSTGFSQDQLAELVKLTLPPDEQAALLEAGVGELGAFAKSITLSIEFATAKQRDEAKELLRRLATEEKRKAGQVVLDAARAYAASPPKQRGKTKR